MVASLSCAKLKFYSRRVVGRLCQALSEIHRRLAQAPRHKIFESVGVAKFQPRTLAGRSLRASSRRCCIDLA